MQPGCDFVGHHADGHKIDTGADDFARQQKKTYPAKVHRNGQQVGNQSTEQHKEKILHTAVPGVPADHRPQNPKTVIQHRQPKARQ